VADPATEQELTRSRENLKGRMVLALESTSARMGRLGGAVLSSMPVLTTDEVIERIDAVGLDDLRALACELFVPERLSVAGVGPAAKNFERASAALKEAARAGDAA
jgi:predicted Zn-dependent peptidase